MPNYLMQIEAAIKNTVKPLLLKDEVRPRVIRAGLGRGLTMLLNRRSELQKEFGIWEIEVQRIYREYIRSGCVVFDVGAGSGDSTLLLARLAAPGSIVAFEPDANLSRLLQQNMALNPDLSNIRIIHRFVGSADEGDEAVALDALIVNHTVPSPDFVKIDVDGAEYNVLMGMKNMLRVDPPVLVIEVHSRELEAQSTAFLVSNSYAVRTIRNAWWRILYPEYRPIALNRWLLGVPQA